MTYVNSASGVGSSVTPPSAQAGDLVLVVSNSAPTNPWLSGVITSGSPYVYAGIYPGTGSVSFSSSTNYLVVVYRPGSGEVLKVDALAGTTSGTTHTTPAISLSVTGQVWAIVRNSSSYGYTWQTAGSPSSSNGALAFLRIGGGDLSPGSYSATATTSGSVASSNRTIAVYPVYAVSGSDSAQTTDAVTLTGVTSDSGTATEAARIRLSSQDSLQGSDSATLGLRAEDTGSAADSASFSLLGAETATTSEGVQAYDITPILPWYEGRFLAGWRVEVCLDGQWVDVSGDLYGLDITDDLDAPGPTATLYLDRQSWHPFTSSLRLTAPVRVWGSIAPLSGSPRYEWPLLYGYIGAIDTSRAQMAVEVYHASEPLLARYVETELSYSGTSALASRIQAILNAAVPDLGITLYAPGVTASVGPQRVSIQPVWRAIEDLAALTGHKLRWLWDGSSWRLTLYQPPRTKSIPDYSLPPSVWLGVQRLRMGIEDVRNVVQVAYGPVGDRSVYTAQDPSSMAKYGRRWARITEASDSQINTHTEAQRLATAVLNDLREPVAEVEVELHWAPFLRLHDLVVLQPDGQALRSPLSVAISGIRHTLRRGQARTTIVGRGQNPPGYYRYWLQREAGRTAAAPGVPPNVGRVPGRNPYTPPSFTAAGTSRGIHVIVPPETDPGYQATELSIANNASFSGAQSYLFTGFTALLTALPDGTALSPGTTYYLRYRYVYRDGRSSAWADGVSVTMPKLGSEDIGDRAIKGVHLDAVLSPDLPGTLSLPGSFTGAALWGKGLDVYKSGSHVLRVGDIGGLSFRGAALPSGTMGLWAPNGYIAVGSGQDVYTAQSSQYTIPGPTFSDVSGASISFTLDVPSVVLLWYHTEAEGVVDISSVASGSNVDAGVYIEARLTTTNTGGGVLNNLHADSIRRTGLSQMLYASSPRFQLRPRGTLAWARLYTLPAGSYTIQLQALRLILTGSGVTASGAGYLYGRGVGALIVR